MTTRWLHQLTLAVALALPVAAVGLHAEPARATTIAPLSIEQLTDASDYVVRGDITEVWTEVDEDGRIWTRARMQVQHVYKGPDDPAVFSEYEEALVFLHQRPRDGRLVPVGKFVGKYTIRRAPGDTRQYARTWHPRAGIKYDARFLPHPAPENRLYLDDLEARIEARLDTGWDGKPIPGLSPERLEQINTRARRRR